MKIYAGATGPSRTIIVEPLRREAPAPEPERTPERAPEPTPTRAPEKVPAGA